MFLLIVCSRRVLCAQEDIALVEPMVAMNAELPDAPSAILQQESQQQESQNGASQETEAERKARLDAEADREVKQQEQQRILAVVPNFNTVISGEGVRLSNGQKTHLAVHATLDPFNVMGAFFWGGVSELNGSHKGYGWGPGGYAKRVAANYVDTVNATMLAGAAYPILLHQDPRFFRQGRGSIRSRVAHALVSAVVCRGDNGRKQPNYSNVLGNFNAGLISNLYYPAEDAGVQLSLVNSSIVTLEGALGNLGLEFSPDVERWMHRKQNPKP
jgi:hypothetical protein